MINNPLNDSEEDVAIEGEEDEESGATTTAIVGAEAVTRVTKNGMNRENMVSTESGLEMVVRSDTARNAGGGRGVHSHIPPLNIFQNSAPQGLIKTTQMRQHLQYLK